MTDARTPKRGRTGYGPKFATRVRHALAAQGMSAYELARQTGIERSSLYNMLSPTRGWFPDHERLVKIAAALELDPDLLYASAGKVPADLEAAMTYDADTIKHVRRILAGAGRLP